MEFYHSIKSGRPTKNTDEILMPGEPETRNTADRRENGIDIDDETVSQLLATADSFKLNSKELEKSLKIAN